MADRNRNDQERLSTDEGIHPEIGTRIGAVPDEDDPVNISGYPGGAAGWGAWPEGEGVEDDAPASTKDREPPGEGGDD